MLKGVIAEDNIYLQKKLEQLVNSLEGIKITFTSRSGGDLLAYLRHNEADLVLLDIGLPDMSGLEVARCIRMQFPDCEIIFITCHDNYVHEAVALYAADYITKPLNVARLKETIGRIKRQHGESDTVLEFPAETGIVFVRENDISMIEALGQKMRIYYRNGYMDVNCNLKTIDAKLGENFFRTSRSYIVNIQKVTAIKPSSRTCYELVLSSNCKAYLSKKLYEQFRTKVKKLQG